MAKKLKAGELLDRIATRTGMSRNSIDQVLKACGDVASEELRTGNALTIPGIGTLSTRYRQPSRKRAFGKVIEIPGKHVPSISWTKGLKELLADRDS